MRERDHFNKFTHVQIMNSINSKNSHGETQNTNSLSNLRETSSILTNSLTFKAWNQRNSKNSHEETTKREQLERFTRDQEHFNKLTHVQSMSSTKFKEESRINNKARTTWWITIEREQFNNNAGFKYSTNKSIDRDTFVPDDQWKPNVKRRIISPCTRC